jgi:hypothetical protein
MDQHHVSGKWKSLKPLQERKKRGSYCRPGIMWKQKTQNSPTENNLIANIKGNVYTSCFSTTAFDVK